MRIRNMIAWLCLIGSCAGGLYKGLYQMFYMAVINACTLYDTGCLTSAETARTIFSVLGSPVITAGWIMLGTLLFKAIYEND